MDIPNRFTLTVTADDIANGEALHCRNCPVALALRAVYPGEWDVADFNAWLDGHGKWQHSAADFIAAFDADQAVSPCTVTFHRFVD
jgi:hypothetical protein